MVRHRRAITDILGLLLLTGVLVELLSPSLLFLPTIAAGGDTPCHYPTAAWFQQELLPQFRLHGWYPGAYLGQPLLLYYFPVPFLVMAALAPLTGLPVAFKLGTALSVLVLPLACFVTLRRMRLPFPAPLIGAAAGLVFLFVEDNPIWGGTIASMLAGEFAYSYGTALGLLVIGEAYRAREDGRGPWLPAALLALTSYAHGYAVLWAGLTCAGLLLWDRRPLRCLGWLSAVATLAFALAAPSLLPLLEAWGWTTPYNDAWIDVTTRGLAPSLLWPLFIAAGLGLGWAGIDRWRGRRADRRLLLFGWAAVTAAALACAGPGLGVIDVRFVPFAQLALSLCGAAFVGLAVSLLAVPEPVTLALVILAAVHGDGRSTYLRSWIDWNYSGLEAKELWPAWRELNDRLKGGVDDPRVAVEYDPLHERAGSIRMYETLPFFSGRSTLEGVYNQASTVTHPVYYLASELFARSPNPFRSRQYSRFDPESALARLRLFHVGAIVATSPALRAFLEQRPELSREAEIPPYTLFRLRDPGPGYVEPLAFEPVRAAPKDWRDLSYAWFSRKPANRALLVFTDDPRFGVATAAPAAAPPERPLPAGVAVSARVEAETITIQTSRPGHPLLVKVAYHPRWRASGAAGPYLVSPGLMLVVPERGAVVLRYAGRTAADVIGMILAGAAAMAILALRRRRSTPDLPGDPVAPKAILRLAVRALPPLLLLALAVLRLLPTPSHADEANRLYEAASRAYADEAWNEAAELARSALSLVDRSHGLYLELHCLQGEALLAAGHAREAVLAFEPVVEEVGAHQAQALYSGARARDLAGDPAGAHAWRRQLLSRYADTPWADRLKRESTQDGLPGSPDE